MNIQTTRPNRPKLYLPFALERGTGTQPNRKPLGAHRTGILPDHELRRLVAQMVG
jgi:hypothetical protein